tara:strand:+ start:575 stop:1300 length:726 start_codon:yes stop_codon:yes gene_type:complete
MKFNYLLIILFLFSCVNNNYNTSSTIFYSSKGFALVYNEQDYKNKIVSKKLNTDKIEASHSKIRRNSIILITNPVNNKSVTLKVSNKSKYPDFYNVLITDKLSKKLELDPDLPFVEIEERVKNKSFIAKKAVTFSEEKNVLTKVPVTKVKINNISKSNNNNFKSKNKYSIIIGNFYSKKWATGLIDILVNENIKKDVFTVKKLSKNNYQLSAGPYTSINTLKNDYFKLNKYGFDNLDIEKN